MMDARENAYVLWFDELRRADVGLVGGKSSSLGELTSSVEPAHTAISWKRRDRIRKSIRCFRNCRMWKIP